MMKGYNINKINMFALSFVHPYFNETKLKLIKLIELSIKLKLSHIILSIYLGNIIYRKFNILFKRKRHNISKIILF